MSTQSEKLTAIANAIRAKEGSSDPIPANDFPARIAAIETGVQLPTLTNPGAAADLSEGKQLIDQNGEIVTGLVQTIEQGHSSPMGGTSVVFQNGNTISIRGTVTPTYGKLYKNGSRFEANLAASNFGNATAADVAAGKTFTSEAGVKVTGTGLLSQTLTAQITGPYMDTFEMVGPGGLVQRHGQAILEQTPIIVPGSVIFISILANSGQRYIPSSNPGFSNAYWVDNITDSLGYQMSYGAFIAQYGQTTYQINFTQR